jgi:hypothetical protein
MPVLPCPELSLMSDPEPTEVLFPPVELKGKLPAATAFPEPKAAIDAVFIVVAVATPKLGVVNEGDTVSANTPPEPLVV